MNLVSGLILCIFWMASAPLITGMRKSIKPGLVLIPRPSLTLPAVFCYPYQFQRFFTVEHTCQTFANDLLVVYNHELDFLHVLLLGFVMIGLCLKILGRKFALQNFYAVHV